MDYVVSGEADGLIADLRRLAVERGREVEPSELPRGVLGPRHRKNAGNPCLARCSTTWTACPRPASTTTSRRWPLRSSIRPGLPLETSRGCWWGSVHQCTFCGLNGTSLGYRVKSPGRVLTELDELQDRYHLSDFEAVDNILDMGYYTSLLAADGRHRRIFYEIKTRLAAACSSWSLVSSRRLTNTALRHLRSTG